MNSKIALLVLAAAAFAVAVGYFSQPFLSQQEQVTEKIIVGNRTTPAGQPADRAYLLLPAVDEQGRGRLAELLVEATPGSGKIFIAFQEDTPLLSQDTQESLKIAIELGKLMATRDVSKLDLKYTMNAPSAVVGGKSAGAAVAVATIALLQGIPLKGDTLITGGVDEQGNIVRVGGVLEKAKAAADAGFRRLVVPAGEATAAVVQQQCQQQAVPGGVARRCTSVTAQIDVAKEAGIEIVEVANVRQALAEMRA